MSRRIDNLHDLFEHELKDIYDAETKLVDALRMQAGETTDPKLRAAFQAHMGETQVQRERLERVFEVFGKEPDRGQGCAGIDGLLEEHKSFKRDEPSPEILDIFNVAAAQKVERYEITAYEGLIRLATQLQLLDVVEILGENLSEEQDTLEKMATFADAPERLQAVKGKPGQRAT